MMNSIRSVILLSVLFLIFLVCPPEGQALLPQHSGFGCLGCHNLHGGAGGALLAEVNFEATCLSCHGPLGTAIEVTIHDPNAHGVGNLGYISCNECHNPHSNNRLNINGGTNIKLIGIEIDYNSDPVVTVNTPQVREESPLSLGPLKEVVFEASPADWGRSGDGLGLCNSCHGVTHNDGADCTACHDHNDSFKGAGCTGCHDGLGVGAESISVDSPHSTNTIFTSKGVTFTCEDCHTGHSAGTIEIPNNTTVGINYGSNGENGIALGGAATTGATEAEICWNCHNTYSVSEWGLNTDSNGVADNFDFGAISGAISPAWVNATGDSGATWTSAQFGYKTSTIQSTHAVDGSATVPGLDPVANIRCSYCHDVHELNTLVGDNSSGKPYLRGTWKGNPYKEDGAPQSGTIYTVNTTYDFGAVPRADSSTSMEMGGYWIDQNTANNPTSLSWTADDSSGLCALCHGSNTDGTWDLVGSGSGNDIDNLNKFDFDELGNTEVASVSWVGTNGHSNAVLGGSSFYMANIFSEGLRKPTDGYCDPTGGPDAAGIAHDAPGYCGGYPNMAYQQYSDHTTIRAAGFRGTIGGTEGFWIDPNVRVNQPYAYVDYMWGATVDDTTTDSQYHQFSCSKCHNPHASRLPRLLISNCLDTSHNTWDDAPATMVQGDTVDFSGSSCSNGTGYVVEFIDLKNSNIVLQSGSFSVGCDREDITLTWNGTDYTLARTDIVNDDASYGSAYDLITLNSAADMENFIGRQVPSTGSFNQTSTSQIYVDNDGVTLSNATSAQNCHRLGDSLQSGTGSGWNTVTPW